MVSKRLIASIVSMLSLSIACFATHAQDKVELKVDGVIEKTTSKDQKTFEFTLAKLKSMPAKDVPAANKYVTGKAVFKGVLLRDLLKEVGVKPNAKSVIFEGSDGYTVRAPIDDAKWNVIIAYEVNGKAMPPKEKGPLWVIYPLDEKPDGLSLRDAVDRMVWNLKKVSVQ
jgi:hypothetical protein